VSGNHVISLLAFFRYSPGDSIIIAVIGALVGVYLFYRGFCLLQRKRLILNTPASKIRSAAMGLVEINGLAVGPYTLTAPITGAPCYYSRTMAWQWQQRGKNSEWVKVADESLHVPFFLDDNTGRILVDPQDAEMDIHRDFHDEFSTGLFSGSMEVPSNVSGFLARNGVSTDKKIKIEEYCIKPKNALFILGTLAQNPGLTVTSTPVRSIAAGQHTVSFHIPGSSARVALCAGAADSPASMFETFKSEAGRTELVNFTGRNSTAPACDPAQTQKITAALLKAGISSPAAWAAAGIGSAAVAACPAASPDAATAAAQFDQHPPVVLMKGTHDPSFLISWHSQRDVVRSLSWKSAFMIWGGPALTLMCAYYVAACLDWL
jgi:hypothetical protein